MFKYYLIAIIGIVFGTYLIYQNIISFDKMNKINAKIIGKNPESYFGSLRYGHHQYYSIALTATVINYKIRIPISEDYFDTAYYNSISDLFDTVKTYTFYINPLGHGIEKVEDGGNPIYLHNRNKERIIWGLVIILVTVLGIVYLAKKYDPVKDNDFWANFRNRNNSQLR